MPQTLLEIRDLQVEYTTYEGSGITLDLGHLEVYEGESFGLVGASGSGKSLTALAVLNLIPDPPGKIKRGEILFRGTDLLKLPAKAMAKVRGAEVATIFQDPMSSLNPVFTVGEQVTRVIRHHQGLRRAEAEARALDLFRLVRLSDPERVLGKYPHELSGGMRQRVMIAMALSCEAPLLIADEATRALDVTIQAGIVELLVELKEKTGVTVIYIASNLGVVAQLCTRMGLLYSGQLVEVGPTEAVLAGPGHPYTRALIDAIPEIGERSRLLKVTEGFPPNPVNPPPGCRFNPRCSLAVPECSAKRPDPVELGSGHHRVWCYKAGAGWSD
ncbi:MAG: ABC transporter ATP-binding protein [Bacillota bacterium]|nr:MAG: ABC transporter ATP-binding protein [Bacillota bacterium]